MKVLFIVVLYEDGCYKKTTTRPNTIKVWIYGRAMAMSKERCGARNWQRRPLNWKLTVVGLLLLILPFEAAKAISVRKCYQLLIKILCVCIFLKTKSEFFKFVSTRHFSDKKRAFFLTSKFNVSFCQKMRALLCVR